MNLFKTISAFIMIIMLSAAILSAPPSLPPDVAEALSKINFEPDYNQHIKPILSDKCFACHGPDKAKQKAGLRLDESTAAYAPLPESPGKTAIKPGNIWKSELVYRIISKDPEYIMPTPASHLSLNAVEKALLVKWIELGAVYQPHWAFVKPIKKHVPVLQNTAYSDNPIDLFVIARLQSKNLKPSPRASKELLLRRLSFDITGLPPSPEELDRFLQDNTPDAYEKQVERLLQSVHYGERMAADWLDLARFADTYGYSVDRYRDMSPYRDWVINAYNSNKSYDRFIHEQLAGDLMPNPTKDMLVATAFNRLHQLNMEGGIVEEEFQTEYVLDRTNTFGEAFMAMSVSCSRCHDHKYDPISQKSYYQMSAFFNNVLEAGQISWNNDMPTPTLLLPNQEQEKRMDSLKRQIALQEQLLEEEQKTAATRATAWLKNTSDAALFGGNRPRKGLIGFYKLNNTLQNELDTSMRGEMKHDAGATGDKPLFVKDRSEQVLQLDGDVYLDLSPAGIFNAAQPFTVGMWLWIPQTLQDGVIFHKSDGERLYNFKGFNVSLKNKRLEITMAHAAPSNAIIKRALKDVPRNQWLHVSLAYDGMGKAGGFQLFQDGEEVPMETIIDKLYKDIIFYRKEEPGLQIGGWWRGTGFTGGKVDDIVIYNRKLEPFEMALLSGTKMNGTQSFSSTNANSIAASDFKNAYYVNQEDSLVASTRRKLLQTKAEWYAAVKDVKQVMVMEETPGIKQTHLLQRGQYDLKGEKVYPGTPSSILPYPTSFPKNRLGLARWLTDPGHPLTARVAINRLWQQFFGTGLVKTSEDFGNQGEMPSHPELLDWLAVHFMESGWDIKKMIQLIVTSKTYQQDAFASQALREQDPENRLLARGPSKRLTAEMLRDQALAASGLINRKTGGESVKPYQPAGLWEINSMQYRADSSEAMYRRSVYVVVKRSVPFPTLAAFDASERSSCLSRRQQTNTPIQALVTLNDPAYVEAARALGAQSASLKDTTLMIQSMFRKLTARYPTERELLILKNLHNSESQKFNNNPEKMKGWNKTGIFKTGNENAALLAANTVVASTIMNSDASITKR